MNINNIFNALRDMYAARFEPEGVRTLAHRFWQTLLGVGLAVILLAIVYGTIELFTALDVLSQGSDSAPPPRSALNRTQLTQVVQGFNDRQTQFENVSKNPPAFSDPSR